MTATNDNELLDPRAAAAMINMSPAWLQLGRQRGFGPPFIRLGHKTVRYARSDLERWLAQRRANEHASNKPVEQDTMQEVLQQIISRCAYDGMAAPFDVVVTDSGGQQLGRRVGEAFDRAIPGMPDRLDRAWPPFKVDVTDAEGEHRTFDVGFVAAPDSRRVPDIRKRH